MEMLFKKMGLSEKQAKIYLAVLELGSCAMTELSQKANLKRPTAYLIVEELLMMGLLSQVSKGKRKSYSAVHPGRLLEIARMRERELEEVLPELLALHNLLKEKPKIQVFTSLEGVRAFYGDVYKALNAKVEALWFSNIETLKAFPESITLYKKVLKKLKNPKIRELNLGNKAGIDWIKEIEPYRGKNHFIRIVPVDFYFQGADTLIFGDKVVVFSLKVDIFVIVIESKNIADTLRAMYEWAWKIAEKFIEEN